MDNEAWINVVEVLKILAGAIAAIAVAAMPILQILAMARVKAINDKLEMTAKEQAAEVEKVKEDLTANAKRTDDKTDALAAKTATVADVVDQIHVLANHAIEIVLADLATSKRHIATLTGMPEDEQAADEAENALAEYRGKQAEVDPTERTDGAERQPTT